MSKHESVKYQLGFLRLLTVVTDNSFSAETFVKGKLRSYSVL